MDDITELNEGDQIQTEHYSNPLTVTETLDSVGIVELKGTRGGSKSLVQNKNNPGQVALMAGADKKGYVSEIRVV